MSGDDVVDAAVAAALAAGASAADAVLVEDDGASVAVRDGVVERVERHGSRGLGVRAFCGTRVGIAYTNTIDPEAARRTAREAVAIAEISAEDPAAGLPETAELGALEIDLDTVDPGAAGRDVAVWIDLATRAEAAARAEPRIERSEGARAGGGRRTFTLANSAGFHDARAVTSAHVHVAVFATGDGGERQRDLWFDAAVHLADLASPEDVGREAARRAVRRCGFRKPPSGAVPVVFSPLVACDFAGTLVAALSAAAVYARGTFLADALGETVGSAALSLDDDPTLPRRSGSRAFDGEGVRARRTPLLEAGRVTSWLADAYAARRAGCASTGAAGRSFDGAPRVGPSNFVLAAGSRPPADVLADIPSGLYVTELFGMGVNLASGAWSRGGAGLWIERGELTHAVQEFTVAGDLRTMLRGVREVASDLTWFGRSAAPTLVLDGLTVSAG